MYLLLRQLAVVKALGESVPRFFLDSMFFAASFDRQRCSAKRTGSVLG